MKFLVRCRKRKTLIDRLQEELHDFETLEEAQEYADFKAKLCRKYGYEFDVQIYELID